MSRPLVVFSDDTIHADAAERLSATCELRILKGSYPPEDVLIDACADASAILARLAVVTRRVIEASPKLRVIARHGVGVDAVDLDAATEHGIVVTTTGATNAAAVAEYTFALLLSLIRKVPQADAGMRAGKWSRENLVGMELEGKTLGVIGLGAIGSRVARQALGFGMRVVAHDPWIEAANVPGIRMTTRDDLLAESDIVTLHMRLSRDTWHTLDAAAIAAMKPGSLLVNTARGELVDESALMAALAAGRIGGAALDTYEREPLLEDSPLRRLSNVLLSPHVAGQTHEALRRVGVAAADAILDVLNGRTPPHVHNREVYDSRPHRPTP